MPIDWINLKNDIYICNQGIGKEIKKYWYITWYYKIIRNSHSFVGENFNLFRICHISISPED